MMLKLLTYLFGCLSGIGLILSIASGLFHVCGWIEDHSARSRKIGQRLSQFCISCTILICIIDKINLSFLFTSLISQSINHFAFSESIHRKLPMSIRLALQTLIPLLPHFIVLQNFHVHHQNGFKEVIDPTYHDKPKLPGGRLDWDAYSNVPSSIRIFSTGEQLSCLALCWLPTFWAYLIAIADSESLPFTNHDRSSKAKRDL